MAVVDGNKIAQYVLFLNPRSLCQLSTLHDKSCFRSPVTGGKNIKPNTMRISINNLLHPHQHCIHQHSHRTHLIPSLGKIGSLPDDDDSLLVGCHKVKGVTKFYDQTATLVPPCGVVVIQLRCSRESPTQVYHNFHGQDIQRLRNG